MTASRDVWTDRLPPLHPEQMNEARPKPPAR